MKMRRGKNRIVRNTTSHTSLRIKGIQLMHQEMDEGSYVPSQSVESVKEESVNDVIEIEK
jgi:hypothetical protein